MQGGEFGKCPPFQFWQGISVILRKNRLALLGHNLFCKEMKVAGLLLPWIVPKRTLSGSSGNSLSCRVGIAHQGLNPGRSHEIGGQCPHYGKATCRMHHLEL